MSRSNLMASVSVLLFAASCAASTPEDPQDISPVSQETSTDTQLSSDPDRNAYFGDLHIHTRNSFDAYIFNVRATADDAYRFAKGEPVQHPSGFEMKIAGGPLDFYAVTDHAEYLGILPAMNTPGTALNALPSAADMFSTDLVRINAAFQDVGASVRTGIPVEELYDLDVIASAWAQNVEAAERHNDPGKFTTFSAYEYTAMRDRNEDWAVAGAGNLHRNVVFADEAPSRAFSSLDSINPEDLWDWMDEQRRLGLDSVAIPHNSNVSDGLMFDMETYEGQALTESYAKQRMRNEPIVEVTQVKGTSETHPSLSPNDEWADFEIWETLIASYSKTEISGGYVREAYQNGLNLQETEGFNPFKFGLVGASDSHVVAGAFSEDDYWSKAGVMDSTPEARGSIPPDGKKEWGELEDNLQNKNADYSYSKWAASGLTGVWAEQNTRTAIFDAFRRKETFATTGPRIKVRFFGGFDYAEDILSDPELIQKAYSNGVSMGGELADEDRAPSFIIWAQRDVNAAALQRAQIVKVTAETEMVYDVACHMGAPDPATHRCPDNGASVDLTTCAPVGDGAAELKSFWTDPDFQPGQHATYYARVLENPTCRWSTWEAIRNGSPPRESLQTTIQERAYTSPIWVAPTGE